MVQFKGQSASATGTITPYTPSVLEFAVKRRLAIIGNRSGAVAYFKLNDSSTSPVATCTLYDFFLETGTQFTAEDGEITTVGVYAQSASFIQAVGW